MNKQEFEAWKVHTEASNWGWSLDPIHNGINQLDYLFYRGGENGQFIMLDADVDGIVTAKIGDYTGAIPHIGEAALQTHYSNEYGTFNDAFLALIHKGGLSFLKDFVEIQEDGLF